MFSTKTVSTKEEILLESGDCCHLISQDIASKVDHHN